MKNQRTKGQHVVQAIRDALPRIIGIAVMLVVAGCTSLPGQHAPPAETPPVQAPPPAVQATAPVAPVPPAPVAAAAPRNDEVAQAASLLAAARQFTGMKPDEQRAELAEATQGLNRERSTFARMKLALLLATPETGLEDEAKATSLLEPVLKGAAGPLKDMASFLAAQLGARVGEKRRAAQFKEQLDQLRAVDRSLLERGQSRGK